MKFSKKKTAPTHHLGNMWEIKLDGAPHKKEYPGAGPVA